MEEKNKLSKITIIVDKIFDREVLDELALIGLQSVSMELGRTLVLRQPEGLRKLLSTNPGLVEDSAERFSFLVQADQEAPAMSHLVRRLGIVSPGKGSLYSRSVTVARSTASGPKRLSLEATDPTVFATTLMGIVCITQKGEANPVASIGLNTGTAVPLVTYGIGTGLRNRLGLWRILVPAEKEVSTLIVDASQAETVMEMMISRGQLDQPGKGFIYLYPVRSGFLNTRYHEGTASQAASVEQIVSVLDELKGSTQWRRKSLSQGTGQPTTRRFLTNLVNFAMTCNAGHGEPMTKVAMGSGATGATISQFRHIDLADSGTTDAPISPAREVSLMTVGEHLVEGLLAALDAAGLFSPEMSGEVQLSPVPRAFTYLK